VRENKYKNATHNLTVPPENIFRDVQTVSHIAPLTKTKLPELYAQRIYITPLYCSLPDPQSNACFIFLMVDLATIDGFAATLSSSYSLGQTPEATLR